MLQNVFQPDVFIAGNDTKQQDVLEYAYLALGFPFTPLSPKEISLLIDSILYVLKKKPLTPEMQEFAVHMQKQAASYQQYKMSIKNFNLTQYLIENSAK